MTRWVYASVALTLLALGGSWYVSAFRYDQLPDRIPTHWGITGEPDGWVAKESAGQVFLLLPACMAGVVVLTLVLPWLSPRHFELDRFRATYGYIMFLVVALFGYIHLATLLGSLQERLNVTTLVLGGMCLFFAAMGNVLGKVRRNFYVGIRTPWTLANDRVWNQTHRLGAWLFVAGGLLGFVLIVAGVPFYVSFALIMIAALAPVLYSLVLYKRLEREGRLEPPAESNQEVSVG